MDYVETMRSFVRVARSGSFTAAASQLGLSRALVSRHVADLEARLSARLLNRSTRYVSLTPEGDAYLGRCERLLSEIEALEGSVVRERLSAKGMIKVHAPKTFGSLVLTDAVIAFSKAQPGIRLSLILGDFTFRPYDFAEHGFDLGIRVSPIRDSALIARKIGTVESVLCAAPRYLKREGAPTDIVELAGRPCLAHLNLAPNDRIWTFQGPKGARSIDVSGPIYSNSAFALRKAALAGVGIAVLPDYCVRRELAEGSLVRLLPQYRLAPRPILVVRPRSIYMTEKVQLFVDFLVTWFKRRDLAAA
ncbi:MAG TPA: LysR family transcriptional regulator [Alphaproteobacteria bacterium]|jgi:DNA-binding transcriptional LysR family regulator|nr:LysR family transcriptional regulator [Alphaproteobacteria bacterium]